MKTSSPTLLLLLVGLACSCFNCQQENDYLPDPDKQFLPSALHSDAPVHMQEANSLTAGHQVVHTGTFTKNGSPDFEFYVLAQKCSRTGMSFKLIMEEMKGYQIYWEADGEVISRTNEIFCVQANQLSVFVKRNSDGYTKSATMQLDEGSALLEAFDVNLLFRDCFYGGLSVAVIPQDESPSYAFLWEIDDQHAGHLNKIDCACGTQATVRITRLTDGVKVKKSMKLPPCNISDN